MKFDDFEMFIQRGAGTTLEFKENFSSSVARELVALANIIGGKILLDVRDDDTVIGAQESNALRARFKGIAGNYDQPVPMRAELFGREFTGHVRENDLDIVQCSDSFLWRQGSATQKLNRDEIRRSFPLDGVVLLIRPHPQLAFQ